MGNISSSTNTAATGAISAPPLGEAAAGGVTGGDSATPAPASAPFSAPGTSGVRDDATSITLQRSFDDGSSLLPESTHWSFDFRRRDWRAPEASVPPQGERQPAADPLLGRFDDLLAEEPEAEAVREFFAGLDNTEREHLARERSTQVGGLDGAPAAVRDIANRQLLEADIAELEAKAAQPGGLTRLERRALENAQHVQNAMQVAENELGQRDHVASSASVQLYVYDAYAFGGDGRAALSVGNLDTAEHVAFSVPGFWNQISNLSMESATKIVQLGAEQGRGDVAVLEWVGYDAPSGMPFLRDSERVVNTKLARSGAELLARDVAGFRASRGEQQPHLTVIGHSYGSTTSAIAAHEFGLQADDLILLANPGTGLARHARELTTGVTNTWIGTASNDAVTRVGITGRWDPSQLAGVLPGIEFELLGRDAAEDNFGARRFRAEQAAKLTPWSFLAHPRGQYLGDDSEATSNIVAIVTGDYCEVEAAAPRHDPWWGPTRDPELPRPAQLEPSLRTVKGAYCD